MTRYLRFAILLIIPSALLAHGDHSEDDHESHYEPAASTDVKPFVTISELDGKRIIESNGIPVHSTGRFPNRNNPNAIRPQQYHFEMPLKPVESPQFTPAGRFPFGVGINGVPFDPGTAEAWKDDPRSGWNIQAFGPGVRLGLDRNDAHVQPTGAYHYHGIPTGLVDRVDDFKRKMTLVGWAADGFPIYSVYGYETPNDPNSRVVELESSYQLKRGRRPDEPDGPGGTYNGLYDQDYEYVRGSGDLDEANGRRGVTPEYPDGTYYYVLTEEYPFVGRFFRGEPDPSFMNRGGSEQRGSQRMRPGPPGEGERRGPPGGPPRGPRHGPPHGPPPEGI